MKKCLNCNIEYDDSVTFCKQCGEKLVAIDVCPNCGEPVDPEDKFCGKCGAKLNRIKTCPNCKEELSEEDLFCPKCGTKIEEKNKVIKKGNNSKLVFDNVRRIISSSLFLVVVTLMIIGFFGDLVVARAPGYGETIGINYFFGQGAKELSNIYTRYQFKEVFTFNLVDFIIHNITYFVGMVGVLVFSIIGVIKAIKSLVNKLEFESKHFTRLIIYAAPYITYTSMVSLAKVSQYPIEGELISGWGIVLLFIGVMLAISGICFNRIAISISKKEHIPSSILESVAQLALAFLMIFGTARYMNLYIHSGIHVQLPVTIAVESILTPYSQGRIATLPQHFALALFAYIFLTLYCFTIPHLFTKDSKGSLKYILISILLFLGVFAGSFTAAAMNIDMNSHNYYVGSGMVVTIVICVISLALFIVSDSLKKKRY